MSSQFDLFDNSTLKTIKEVKGSCTFLGYNKNYAAATSDASWFIKRIYTSGNITEILYANDSFSFDQKWDDKDILFPAITTPNSISTNFDGVDDFCDGGDIHKFDLDDPFSISMWVKVTNMPGNNIIFSKVTGSPNIHGYRLEHDSSGNLKVVLRSPGGDVSHTSSLAMSVDTWHHITLTYSGNSNINGTRIYIDGVVGDTPSSDTLGGTWLEGQSFKLATRTGGNNFTGFMDEVSVWNIALSTTQVSELYNSGVPTDPSLHSKSANLVSWYRMGDGDVYPTISDQIGSEDLVMTNMSVEDFVGDVI